MKSVQTAVTNSRTEGRGSKNTRPQSVLCKRGREAARPPPGPQFGRSQREDESVGLTPPQPFLLLLQQNPRCVHKDADIANNKKASSGGWRRRGRRASGGGRYNGESLSKKGARERGLFFQREKREECGNEITLAATRKRRMAEAAEAVAAVLACVCAYYVQSKNKSSQPLGEREIRRKRGLYDICTTYYNLTSTAPPLSTPLVSKLPGYTLCMSM